LDHASIRDIWRTAKSQPTGASPSQTTPAAPTTLADSPVTTALRRASIVVMPFAEKEGERGGYANGLAHDVITRLAKLRSLFVIAQGTAFALHERCVSPEEASRALNVDYVVAGSVQQDRKRLIVAVELAETRTARIVWAEVFDHKLDDAFL